MSETSQALGMPIPEPHVDTWNESMGMVTDALEAIDAFAGDIATVEESPSTAAHSVGEFIIYGGRLYKVTAAIAQGDSLTLGTNVEAANVGSRLTELGSGITELGGGINSLEASIAPVESTTAAANHSAGDYFMLGNVLMCATSAIATGEQITTSNATPATLQGQIDTLRDSVNLHSLVVPSTELNGYNLIPTTLSVASTLPIAAINATRYGWTYSFTESTFDQGVWSVVVGSTTTNQPSGSYGMTVLYIER